MNIVMTKRFNFGKNSSAKIDSNPFQISSIIINNMGGATSGSLNNKGYSQSISQGHLPSTDHITYPGSFNELYFSIGGKAKEVVQLYYGLSVSNSPIKSPTLNDKNYFIGIFSKSRFDGEKRQVPIHATIVLDVSGSMGGNLSYNKPGNQNRMTLAKEAIKLFYSKLNDEDVFSLVTFNDQGKTVIPSEMIKNLDKAAVFAMVDGIAINGGTTLKSGFLQAQKNFKQYEGKYESTLKYQKRIIMLTDVGDNSMQTENQFVAALSQSEIHTTIVGISADFRASTCEKLIKIKGFNYFCATQDSDLQLHLYDHFDYTFFPCAYNLEISLHSDNIVNFDVYGSPDANEVHTYSNPALKNKKDFVITRMESSFPSDFSKDKEGKESTQGGLILVKFTPRDLGTLRLSYNTTNGEAIVRDYPLQYKLELEEFHTCDSMAKAANAFYYTYCTKEIVNNMQSPELKLSDINKGQYLEQLRSLRDMASEDKKKEVDSLIQVVEKYQVAVNKPDQQ